VTAQEIELERGQLIGGNRHFCERTEAGVHAVHGHAARGVLVDDVARGGDARARVGRQTDRFRVMRDARERVERES
jgi:hypothetical protein